MRHTPQEVEEALGWANFTNDNVEKMLYGGPLVSILARECRALREDFEAAQKHADDDCRHTRCRAEAAEARVRELEEKLADHDWCSKAHRSMVAKIQNGKDLEKQPTRCCHGRQAMTRVGKK